MKKKSIGIIGVLIFLVVCTSTGFARNIFSSRRIRAYENKVVKLETTTKRFIAFSQHNSNLQDLNGNVQEYNAWIGEYEKKLEKMINNLEASAKKVEEIKAQIKHYEPLLKNRPSVNNSLEVDDYNQLVTRREVLVASANSLIKKRANGVAIYNSEIEKFNTQKERRTKKLNISRNQYIAKNDIYKDFIDSDKDVELSIAVNKIFALLINEARSAGRTGKLDNLIARIARLRKDLAGYAISQYEKLEHGLVIVKLRLSGHSGRFNGWFVVDTGAMLTTVSPALIDALGLAHTLGEKEEFTLAGGKKIWGRSCVMPKISYNKWIAKKVPIAAVKESRVGVDGLLGQSFFKRYVYCIDETTQDKLLILRER